MEQLLTLIQQYGFPAGMCLVLAWYCKYLWDMYAKSTEAMEQRYQQQLQQAQEIIVNNTQAMTTLTENIRQLKEDVKDNA